MALLGFDIDGVLANTTDPLLELISINTNIDVRNTPCYDIEKGVEGILSRKGVLEVFDFVLKDTEAIYPYPGAREIVKWTFEQTEEPVHFVTSRALKHASVTHWWLQDICEDIPFFVSFDEKFKFAKFFDWFVEDRRKTAIQLAEMGVNVIVPTRSYNDLPDGIPQRVRDRIWSIHSLTEIPDIISRRGWREMI